MSQFALPDRDNDHKNTRLRLTALDQAIVYLQNRQAGSQEVVDVAAEFLKFLEGDDQ